MNKIQIDKETAHLALIIFNAKYKYGFGESEGPLTKEEIERKEKLRLAIQDLEQNLTKID